MAQENTLSPEFQKVMGLLNACKEEVSKRVVGQGDVVEGILVSLLVGGMCCWRVCQDWRKPFW